VRIAANLLYLLPGYVGGTETYAVSLLSALARVDRENEYLLFVNQESAGFCARHGLPFEELICPLRASSRLQRYVWEQAMLPIQLRHHRVDIVHSLGYVSPVFAPCASVVTIHDLNTVALQDVLSWKKRIALSILVRESADRADRVLTVSEFSRSEIQRYLGTDPSKISVVYEGPRRNDRVPAGWDELEATYGLRKPYVAAFGSVSVHKNIPCLVDAFAAVSAQVLHSLVIVGHTRPPAERAIADARHRGVRVVTTGYVPDAHISPLLSHADLFVFPSLYEGFGLPALEAQQAGVPLLSSDAGSLPEVAGEGAYYFDPHSVEDLSQALRTCLQDRDLRERLRRKGAENVARFSWEQAAQQTLRAYELAYQHWQDRNGARG